METVEPFGAFEEEHKPSSHVVTLKDGLDLQMLSSGQGIEFEIDDSVPPVDTRNGEEEEEGFDQEDVYKQLNYECGVAGGEDSDNGLSPFERMARNMEDLTGDRGVLKKVLQQGIGPMVPEGAIVRVHYNGYLEYSDEPYDSSRLRNRQQQFTLWKGEVIPGWEVGVSSMKRTELARFLVKPEYAFGSLGCPPRIPPDATIMFEIELVSFVDHKAADEFESFTRQERREATLEQLIAVANAEREAGNDFFQQKMFGRASSKYNRAVRLLEETRLKNEEEEIKWKAILLKLYLNLSLCSIKQTKSKLAITQCRKALELDPKNVKAHFRLGQAYMQMSEFRKSKEHLTRAGKLRPGSEEIRQELLKLDSAVRKFQVVEKSMYAKMFHTTPASASSESANEALVETRKVLRERLSAFKEEPNMTELVLPATLDASEIRCAEEVAKELELETEQRAQFGLRILKPAARILDEDQFH